MKTKLILTSLTAAGFTVTAQAASLSVGFQQTIGSEQHPDATSEGGPYHVSVNPNNAGYAAVNYRLPNSSTDGTDYQRAFSDPVLGYAFVGGGQNNVLTISHESGGFITYTTSDMTFDGFAQRQLQLWTVSDPGADLINPLTTRDFEGPGYRAFGDITAEVDISGLASGTVNIFYGAFSARPSVSVVMRDTSGIASDITVLDAHLNGDTANRAEYYAAELDFETDGVYDVIVYTWLANGSDNTGNGRFGGTVLTGVPIPEPSSLALLGLGGLVLLRRRR